MLRILASLSLLLLLSACARVQPVPLDSTFWQNHQQKVTVAKAPTPKAKLYQVGQEGLLEYAINQAVTDKFQQHLKRTNMQWYQQLQANFVRRLKARGIQATPYQMPIREKKFARSRQDNKKFAQRNFIPLATTLNKDRLLLVNVKAVGAQRRYYGFIPLGNPDAILNMEGKLVDLRNNRILWRYEANTKIPVSKDWDQPPSYPNFDRALKVAIDTSSQELLDSFFADQG